MKDCEPQALGGDGDGGDRHVDAARAGRREQRLEVEAFDVDGHADALGRLVDDVDLEAFEIAVLGLGLERRVVRIGADIEHVLGEAAAGAAAKPMAAARTSRLRRVKLIFVPSG